MPNEIRLALKSIRVFGQFDDSTFAELYKHVQTIELAENEYLFRVGDRDDCMYVVQSGTVRTRNAARDDGMTVV